MKQKLDRREMDAREYYLRWLAGRRGIELPHNACFCAEGIRAGNGLIMAMPGYGQPQTVIMEQLDDAGEVIRASTIGLAKNGQLGIKADAVRAAVGPIAKPTRERRAAARAKISPAERVEVEQAVECHAMPTPTPAAPRAKRTEVQKLAITRAWRMRTELRASRAETRAAVAAMAALSARWQALQAVRDQVTPPWTPSPAAALRLVAAQ